MDDELAGQDVCATAKSTGMKIRAGKSYGRASVKSVKFPLTDSQFSTFYAYDSAKPLDLKLSVNPLISIGVAGEVTVARGSELLAQDWQDPTVFPTVVLYLAPTIVINNLQVSQTFNDKYIDLREVQLYRNNVLINPGTLQLTLSSTYAGQDEIYGTDYSASNCFDNTFTHICHSGINNPNPTLTVISPQLFDKVVVYNRVDHGAGERIEGATITATVNGQSKSALFPQTPDEVFTFTYSYSSGLQLYLSPTNGPTLAPTVAVTGFSVVINNLQPSKSYNDKYINLREVKLFNNNVQLDPSSLTVTLSGTYPGYPASNCNDADLSTICNSDGPDPNLTIVASAVFDKVVVYNRVGAGDDRIEGATITTTVNGQSASTTFPGSNDLVFTFTLSAGTLVLV